MAASLCNGTSLESFGEGTSIPFSPITLKLELVPSSASSDLNADESVREAVRNALEFYLNCTLSDQDENSGYDDGSFGYTSLTSVSLKTRQRDIVEPVRMLQSGSSMTLTVEGTAFYQYGPGGWIFSSAPSTSELDDRIEAALEDDGGTSMKGGRLALALEDLLYDQGGMDMFQSVQGVDMLEQEIFTTTLPTSLDTSTELTTPIATTTSISPIVNSIRPTYAAAVNPTDTFNVQSEYTTPVPNTASQPTIHTIILPTDAAKVTKPSATSIFHETNSNTVYIDKVSSTNNSATPGGTNTLQSQGNIRQDPMSSLNKTIIASSLGGAFVLLSIVAALFVRSRSVKYKGQTDRPIQCLAREDDLHCETGEDDDEADVEAGTSPKACQGALIQSTSNNATHLHESLDSDYQVVRLPSADVKGTSSNRVDESHSRNSSRVAFVRLNEDGIHPATDYSSKTPPKNGDDSASSSPSKHLEYNASYIISQYDEESLAVREMERELFMTKPRRKIVPTDTVQNDAKTCHGNFHVELIEADVESYRTLGEPTPTSSTARDNSKESKQRKSKIFTEPKTSKSNTQIKTPSPLPNRKQKDSNTNEQFVGQSSISSKMCHGNFHVAIIEADIESYRSSEHPASTASTTHDTLKGSKQCKSKKNIEFKQCKSKANISTPSYLPDRAQKDAITTEQFVGHSSDASKTCHGNFHVAIIEPDIESNPTLEHPVSTASTTHDTLKESKQWQSQANIISPSSLPNRTKSILRFNPPAELDSPRPQARNGGSTLVSNDDDSDQILDNETFSDIFTDFDGSNVKWRDLASEHTFTHGKRNWCLADCAPSSISKLISPIQDSDDEWSESEYNQVSDDGWLANEMVLCGKRDEHENGWDFADSKDDNITMEDSFGLR